MENPTVPNPAPNVEPVVTPVEVPVQTPKSNKVLMGSLLLLSLLLLLSTAFLFYQNMQLKNTLASYQTQPMVSPIPNIYQSPVSSSTTDLTVNWKTYISKNGAFSFKYPEDWFLWNSPDGDSILLDKSSFDPNLIVEPDQVEITFTATSSKELIDAYMANFVPTSQVTTNSNVVFKIKDKSLGPKEEGPASQYLFAQTMVGNNLYRFGLTHPTYKTVFDQILSTFQFTK